MQWRKNQEHNRLTQHIPRLKEDHSVMPGGQVESGMELLLLQPLCLGAQCSSWTQRCAVPSWVLCHSWSDGWCPGLAGQAVAVS